MDGEEIEAAIRSLFADLKKDNVESLLIQSSYWGFNIRMFLNGDILELDLIKFLSVYEVTFIDNMVNSLFRLTNCRD